MNYTTIDKKSNFTTTNETSQKKTDRRIRKTKLQLRNALLQLLKNKNISNITINELVTVADVNRSTFYLHYNNMSEILSEIETELLEKFNSILKSHEYENKVDFLALVIDLFQFFDENKDTCVIVMGKHGNLNLLQKLESILETTLKKHKVLNIPNYLHSFLKCGLIGMMTDWSTDTEGHSAEEMAVITYEIIANFIKWSNTPSS